MLSVGGLPDATAAAIAQRFKDVSVSTHNSPGHVSIEQLKRLCG